MPSRPPPPFNRPPLSSPPPPPRHRLLGFHRHPPPPKRPSPGHGRRLVHGQRPRASGRPHPLLSRGACDDADQHGAPRLLGTQGEEARFYPWALFGADLRHSQPGPDVRPSLPIPLHPVSPPQVQIEGTSGEGSSLVRSFRPYTKRLMEPLEAALLRLPLSPARAGISTGEGEGVGEGEGEGEDDLQQALLAVYEFPEAYPALYAYIKVLASIHFACVSFRPLEQRRRTDCILFCPLR